MSRFTSVGCNIELFEVYIYEEIFVFAYKENTFDDTTENVLAIVVVVAVTLDVTTFPLVNGSIFVFAVNDKTAVFVVEAQIWSPLENAAALFELIPQPLNATDCDRCKWVPMNHHISIAVFVIYNSVDI